MKTLLVSILLGLPFTSLLAQRATIDEMDVEVTCSGEKQAVCRQRVVTTIHSEKGADEADFICSLGKTDELKQFSGTAADASGRVLRKFKKSDLERSEFSSHLAVNAYKQGLSYVPPVYPVTITYEWTIQYNDDLLSFPSFIPQRAYGVNVRQAHYRLSLPRDFQVRHALQNIDEEALKTSSDGKGQVIELFLKDLPAIERLDYARPIQERVPFARFIPLHFNFFGTEGSLQSWQSYGSWAHRLLQGRDHLPEDIRRRVHQLVEGCTTDRERVERVYQFLGQTTRYVSIQLGIGGHQPAPAAEVARTGFGDCKGLSNYMHALLKEIGIPSVYTEIGTEYRHLLPNFPCSSMLNHVILQVPLPADTIWIECTNPKLPLGYVHRDIAGHDAVLITPEGGQLCHLPSYPDSLHAQRSVAAIDLHADGSARIQIRQTSQMGQYETLRPLLDFREEDRKRAVGQLFRLPDPSFHQLEVSGQGSSLLLDVNVESRRYASPSGTRLMVPLCPLHNTFQVPSLESRTEPMYIAMGYEDVDTITLHLPEGYGVESLPKPQSMQLPFGEFSQQIEQHGDTLMVVNRLLIRAGSYPVPLYLLSTDFMKKVVAAYSAKAVLRKNDNK